MQSTLSVKRDLHAVVRRGFLHCCPGSLITDQIRVESWNPAHSIRRLVSLANMNHHPYLSHTLSDAWVGQSGVS
jgi:hypothetical protein